MTLPFAALLAAIALAPLFFAGWWAKNYPKVAFALGAVTVGYYWFGLHAHERALETAAEYVKFIALIGSLFVVSGGIHINVRGEATPLANVLFLFIGAVLANVLGTTGASMLLIRPWIRMNKYRITGHRLLHFHRVERGRLSVPDRRSAVVHGLPQRRPVLVGGAPLLAHVGRGHRDLAGHVLPAGQCEFSSRAKTGPGSGNGARALAY
jgi:hypothetical protein